MIKKYTVAEGRAIRQEFCAYNVFEVIGDEAAHMALVKSSNAGIAIWVAVILSGGFLGAWLWLGALIAMERLAVLGVLGMLVIAFAAMAVLIGSVVLLYRFLAQRRVKAALGRYIATHIKALHEYTQTFVARHYGIDHIDIDNFNVSTHDNGPYHNLITLSASYVFDGMACDILMHLEISTCYRALKVTDFEISERKTDDTKSL